MTYTITVHFDIEAESPQHAVFKAEKWLKEKGIEKCGEVEVTLDRTEPRFGYKEITTKRYESRKSNTSIGSA